MEIAYFLIMLVIIQQSLGCVRKQFLTYIGKFLLEHFLQG
jgi:hypothetical protein